MKSEKYRNSFLLLIAAIIWGTAFVAQSIGNRYIGPFTFNACRFILGGFVVLPVALFTSSRQKKMLNRSPSMPAASPDAQKTERKTLFIGGICCGICLFMAGGLQQLGMLYTTVGKAGFVTAMYILIVPIISLILFRKKVGVQIWISVAIAVFGMYLLCMTEGFSVNKGDVITLCSAFVFASHILVIDHFSPMVNGVALSCIQFFTAGLLSLIPVAIFEEPTLAAIMQAGPSIAYLGICSSGIAYTLQIIAQKGLNPTVASLIMSLESAISAISGWIILGEALSAKELTGCIIMFCAIVLAQLPFEEWKRRRQKSA